MVCILLIQLLYGLYTTFPHSSCDCDTCDMTLSYTPSYVVSPKRKKKKVNINNNLAILPSYNILSSRATEKDDDEGVMLEFLSMP